MNRYSVYLLLLPFLLSAFVVKAQSFELTDKTGKFISDKIMILDTDSNVIELNKLLNKVTVLSLVYFDCDQNCPKLMEGIYELIRNTREMKDLDYQVLTIGFRPDHHLNKARSVEDHYKEMLKKDNLEQEKWQFFITDTLNTRLLTQNIGYKYYHDNDRYMHTSLLTVVSPGGKIINYMYGTRFLALDFEMTWQNAIHEIPRITVPRNIKYCANYRAPAHEHLHKMAIIFGLSILLCSVTLFLWLVFKRKSRNEI